MIVWILIGCSLAVLLFGLSAYRATRSRPVAANVAFGSMGLLYTAWQAQKFGAGDWVAVMVFLITMLLVGRAVGAFVRSRREPELRHPAWMLAGAAATAAVACAATSIPLLL